MKTCVFAGTFDPITIGHEKLIEKCLSLYEKVIIVVGENAEKTTLFSSLERAEIISEVYNNNDRILVIEYANYKENFSSFLLLQGATDYVRGIRNNLDKDYEQNQIETNKKLYPFINTIFIDCEDKYKQVNSTLVRQKLLNGEDANEYMSKRAFIKAKEILLQKKQGQN